MNLSALMELVEIRAVPEEEYLDREKAMEAIYIVQYSGKNTCGQVDFSQFTRDQFVLAMSEVLSYVSDEAGGDEGNSENLLTEINRIAHFGQKLNGIKLIKAKKKFI